MTAEDGGPFPRADRAQGPVTEEQGLGPAGGSRGSLPRAGGPGPVTKEPGRRPSGGSGGSLPRASTAKAPATEEQGPQASGGPGGSLPRASKVRVAVVGTGSWAQ